MLAEALVMSLAEMEEMVGPTVREVLAALAKSGEKKRERRVMRKIFFFIFIYEKLLMKFATSSFLGRGFYLFILFHFEPIGEWVVHT